MFNRDNLIYKGSKDQRGEPLCPLCGSKQVYPVKSKYLFIFQRTQGWSCANENCRMYRKLFPNPSWGSVGWHR